MRILEAEAEDDAVTRSRGLMYDKKLQADYLTDPCEMVCGRKRGNAVFSISVICTNTDMYVENDRIETK